MYQPLFQHAEYIIACAEILLSREYGILNDKQAKFVTKIAQNAEMLIAVGKAFQSLTLDDHTTPDEISHLRHELSNPITPMLGYTELMLMGKTGELTEGQQEGLHAIFASIRVLNEVIEEIAQMSRQWQAASAS